METNDLFISNMWGHLNFAMCLVFFIVMLLFMVLGFFFYRRRRWSWMWHHAACWDRTSRENPENIIKNRLAKGEINEVEYNNLLRKIRSY